PDLSMLPEAERPAVARALAKHPEGRWPSCRAFVDALVTGAQVQRQPPPPAAAKPGTKLPPPAAVKPAPRPPAPAAAKPAARPAAPPAVKPAPKAPRPPAPAVRPRPQVRRSRWGWVLGTVGLVLLACLPLVIALLSNLGGSQPSGKTEKTDRT